jgi:hypothetical protein
LNFLTLLFRFFDFKIDENRVRNLTWTSLNGLFNAHTTPQRPGGSSQNPGKHIHSSRILCQLFGNFNDNCGSVLMIFAARFLDILGPVFDHFWAAFSTVLVHFVARFWANFDPVFDHFWAAFSTVLLHFVARL